MSSIKKEENKLRQSSFLECFYLWNYREKKNKFLKLNPRFLTSIVETENKVVVLC